MTTKADFLTSEWKQILNAPHWVYIAMTEGDRTNFIIRRQEAKALDKFLDDYEPSTRLIKYIIGEQKDADDISGSFEDAKSALESVGRLIDSKATDKEEAAIRGFLIDVAEAIADAVSEQRKLIGSSNPVSDHEKKAMEMIERALNAQSRSSLRGTSQVERRSSSSMADAIKKQVQGPAPVPAAPAPDESDSRQLEVQQRAAERKARKEAEAKELQAEEARQRAKAQSASEQSRKEVEAQREAAADRRKDAEESKRADLEQKSKEAAERREEVGERRSKSVQQDAPAPSAAPALQTYVVKPGDTLSHISLHFYGTAHRWNDIFEANRTVLNNPNLIIPGQELTIPA